MKMFNDSHLEVKKFFKGTFFTHPYEAGSADEAIFFVMVEKHYVCVLLYRREIAMYLYYIGL